MFFCTHHNWTSSESPCPACHQTITVASANTQSTGAESPSLDARSKEEILSPYLYIIEADGGGYEVVNPESALQAMEEYAQQFKK